MNKAVILNIFAGLFNIILALYFMATNQLIFMIIPSICTIVSFCAAYYFNKDEGSYYFGKRN